MDLATLADSFVHIDVQMTKLLAEHGRMFYLILFGVIFAETGLVIFPFLPGDSLLFAIGALIAGGKIDPALSILALWSAALIGNSTNYWIGRWVGKRVFKWEDGRFFNRRAFNRAHDFYQKHGGKTIIAARFIPFVRTFAPFVAGVALMDYARFLLMDLLGATLWIGSLVLAGYMFGNIPVIKDNLGLIVLILLGLSLIPTIFVALRGRKMLDDMSK